MSYAPWSCHACVPVYQLIYAAFRSNAKGQLVSCAANGVKANDNAAASTAIMRVMVLASGMVWVEKVS